MKLILKTKNRVNENSQQTTKATFFRVTVSPKVFLALTPSDARSQIDLRAAVIASTGGFSQEKAGDMFLTVDPRTGEIINHSGRARSKAADGKVPQIEITIRLPEGHAPVSWADLPDKFNQQEGSNRVSKENFTLVHLKDTTRDSDPLQLGGNTKIFSDEIMPAATLPSGYQRPAMKTKDAEAAAKAFIKAGLARYADSVKRNLGASDLDTAIAKSGLGQNEYVEKNAQDFQKILDSAYNVEDEKSELTFSFMEERYKGRFWGRQPVGVITISKK